ncbi:MAG: hypothetical protein ACR2NN_00240 [Bryobacteraceae bacterium]
MQLFKNPFSKMPFRERLLNVAFFVGLPSLGVELIGARRGSWLMILLIIVPGTTVGVMALALIEHWAFLNLTQRKDGSR